MELKPYLDLELARKELQKKFGRPVLKYGHEDLLSDVKRWIPTGITLMDTALGGGIPVGRMVEFSGEESSGKSTWLVHLMAGFQSAGGIVVLIDSESTFSKDRAVVMGLDVTNNFVVVEAKTLEEGFQSIAYMLNQLPSEQNAPPTLFVWDTISASPTASVKEGEKYGEGIQSKPRAISVGLQQITMELPDKCATLVFANQVRDTFSRWGGGEDTNIGRAVKFHSSIRVSLHRSGSFVEKGENVGIGCKVHIIKNKVASPQSKFTTALYYDSGVDDLMSNFTFLASKEVQVIQGSSGWYKCPEFGEMKNWRATDREVLRESVASYPGFEDWMKEKIQGMKAKLHG